MIRSSRCLALLLGAVAMLAQQARPPFRPQAKRPSRNKSDVAKTPLTPRLFMLDAVAETPDGQPARNLTAADFALSVNGQPAKIGVLHAINAEAGTIAPASTRIALKPDQIHRTLIFVADDLSLSVASARDVRGALTGFLDQQMRPTDLVSIVRTASGTGVLQKLTSNRRELEEAIRGIQYNPASAAAEAFASGARSTLLQVLQGLRTQLGRKGLVLLSANHALFDKAATDSLLAEAQGSSTVVSLVDLHSGASPDAPLAALARKTGGRFATALDGLAGILGDQAGYYLVTYEPPPADAGALLLVQRPILTAARPGLLLRARDGFLNTGNFTSDAVERDLWRPSFTTPATDLRHGLVDPFAAAGIPVRFIAVWGMGKSGGEVDGRLFIDTKDLTYTHWLNGRVTCTLDIQITAVTENGFSLQSDSHTYDIQLTAERFQEWEKRGFTASPSLLIRAPGAYQVRISVRDGTSGRIGSASQFMLVPDVAGGQLTVSGISAMSLDKLNPGLAPFQVFRPSETYRYTYQILNASSDESKRSQIESQSRIFRDGEPIFESQLTPVSFSPSEDPKRRVAETELRLGKLEPGFYVLEFMVTDKLSKEPRTAAQYSRFEVQ